MLQLNVQFKTDFGTISKISDGTTLQIHEDLNHWVNDVAYTANLKRPHYSQLKTTIGQTILMFHPFILS